MPNVQTTTGESLTEQRTRRSRRAVRETEVPTSKVEKSSWIPRAGILTTLGALSFAVPFSGFVSPHSAVAMPARVIGAVPVGQTWDATGEITADGGEQAQALREAPGAVSRARIRESMSGVDCKAARKAASGEAMVGATDNPLYWPMSAGSYRQASPFGYRIHPISHTLKLHEGTDLAAPAGTPIYAIANGKVVSVESTSYGGEVVRIRHTVGGKKWDSLYLHMYARDVKVKAGQQVKAGKRIGAVGSAGISTGPHLHLEIRNPDTNAPLDPLGWMQKNGVTALGEGAC